MTTHNAAQAVDVRDPRVTPVRGDVVSNGDKTYYVTRVQNGDVYYTDAPPVAEMTVTIDEWRSYSKDDVVVTLGEVQS